MDATLPRASPGPLTLLHGYICHRMSPTQAGPCKPCHAFFPAQATLLANPSQIGPRARLDPLAGIPRRPDALSARMNPPPGLHPQTTMRSNGNRNNNKHAKNAKQKYSKINGTSDHGPTLTNALSLSPIDSALQACYASA